LIKFPVLVNDNTSAENVGDLCILYSKAELRVELEDWYVDELYFAFDAEGKPITLILDENEKLDFIESSGRRQPEIVRRYLEQYSLAIGISSEDLSDKPNTALAKFVKQNM